MPKLPIASRREAGLTTVEFAIVGAVFFMALFGVIEMGHALFVANTLTEATRRGARMAAVCPVGDPAPANAAVFGDGNGGSTIIYGLSTSNVEIDYLDASGNLLADPVGSFGSIAYVRAKITGFTLPLAIPFVDPTITFSGLETTIPRESLGVTPSAITPC